jgi:hypothetical protein
LDAKWTENLNDLPMVPGIIPRLTNGGSAAMLFFNFVSGLSGAYLDIALPILMVAG